MSFRKEQQQRWIWLRLLPRQRRPLRISLAGLLRGSPRLLLLLELHLALLHFLQHLLRSLHAILIGRRLLFGFRGLLLLLLRGRGIIRAS